MRLSALLVTLLATTLVLSACAPSEPVISADAAQEIRDALGYALAPTYLPDGFEPAKAISGVKHIWTVGDTKTATLLYAQYASNQQSPSNLSLSYPGSYGKSSPLMERLGMVHPEDAVTETSINGETAYLFHGRWTAETLDRLTRLDMSQDAEWEYDNGHVTIRFEFVVPNGERIWVLLGPVFPADEVTEKDIIRVAESVVIVD